MESSSGKFSIEGSYTDGVVRSTANAGSPADVTTDVVIFGWTDDDICRQPVLTIMKSLPALSSAEQALMDLIWQKQPLSVAALLDLVNAERPEPISRNTLQTQLTRLEAKGWLKHEDGGKVRHYSSAVPAKRGRGKMLTELKERLFGGSSLSLVRCLVEEGGLTDAEIKELNDLIKDHRKGGKP